jgi:hypothetical protein
MSLNFTTFFFLKCPINAILVSRMTFLAGFQNEETKDTAWELKQQK